MSGHILHPRRRFPIDRRFRRQGADTRDNRTGTMTAGLDILEDCIQFLQMGGFARSWFRAALAFGALAPSGVLSSCAMAARQPQHSSGGCSARAAAKSAHRQGAIEKRHFVSNTLGNMQLAARAKPRAAYQPARSAPNSRLRLPGSSVSRPAETHHEPQIEDGAPSGEQDQQSQDRQ